MDFQFYSFTDAFIIGVCGYLQIQTAFSGILHRCRHFPFGYSTNNLILPPVGDKRVSFVSILFFAHVGIYEQDHKQTFGPGALLGDLALFYVVVGELPGAG